MNPTKLKNEYFCTSCIRNQPAKHFSNWLLNTSRLCKCNHCLKRVSDHVRLVKDEAKRKSAKPKPLTKSDSTTASKAEASRKFRDTKDRLYKAAERKRLNDELGFL